MERYIAAIKLATSSHPVNLMNLANVLKTIHEKPNISYIQLCSLTNLSNTTIHRAIRLFREHQLLDNSKRGLFVNETLLGPVADKVTAFKFPDPVPNTALTQLLKYLYESKDKEERRKLMTQVFEMCNMNVAIVGLLVFCFVTDQLEFISKYDNIPPVADLEAVKKELGVVAK